MRLEAWQLSFLIVPSLILAHLWLAPYTKVEESFNIQAVYDFLTYGLPLKNAGAKIESFYDHIVFPGAVPRTFIGALALAGISNPFVRVLALDAAGQQMLVRGVLGMISAASILFYTAGVRQAYGKSTAAWLVALQASQFHMTFYATRTLPNTFAYAMTTFALRYTLPEPAPRLPLVKRAKLALYLMTLATIIFRAEVALLLVGHCLVMLIRSSDSFSMMLATTRGVLLPALLIATVAGLILTVTIDTFMWRSQRLLWPEAAAFLSNVFPPPGSQGASAWGTSPWHWYLTSALPRLTATPLIWTLPGYVLLPTPIRRQLQPLTFPALIYIGLYSILPHKETRFLFPILPTLNTALAIIAGYFTSTRSGSASPAQRVYTLILMLTTSTAFFASHFIILPLSSLSYPGGHALSLLHDHAATIPIHQTSIHVHLTNLALQTGITHFLEHPATSPNTSLATTATWTYDKSPNTTNPSLPHTFWSQFDYIITEPRLNYRPILDPKALHSANPANDLQDIGHALSLGRPRITTLLWTLHLTNTTSAAARRRLYTHYPGARHGDDDIALLLRRMYGNTVLARVAVGVYEAARSVGMSKALAKVTGGRWIGWQEDVALVVRGRKGLGKGEEGEGRVSEMVWLTER